MTIWETYTVEPVLLGIAGGLSSISSDGSDGDSGAVMADATTMGAACSTAQGKAPPVVPGSARIGTDWQSLLQARRRSSAVTQLSLVVTGVTVSS